MKLEFELSKITDLYLVKSTKFLKCSEMSTFTVIIGGRKERKKALPSFGVNC